MDNGIGDYGFRRSDALCPYLNENCANPASGPLVGEEEKEGEAPDSLRWDV